MTETHSKIKGGDIEEEKRKLARQVYYLSRNRREYFILALKVHYMTI